MYRQRVLVLAEGLLCVVHQRVGVVLGVDHLAPLGILLLEGLGVCIDLTSG